jgi:RND family efflux transporter MFP subunit
MKNKKLWISLLVILAVAALAGITVAKKPNTQEKLSGFKDGVRINTERVRKGTLQTKISTNGKLEAQDTHIIYAEANNKIIGIHKKVGETVKKGEVILTLDTDSQQKTKKQLEALDLQLKAAQEAVEQLITGGSEREILNAQAAVVQTQKAEQDAKDQLDTAKTNFENFERDLKNQKKDYEVAVQLLSEGLISQKEMDDAKTKLTDLEQKAENTKASITSLQKSIEAAGLQKKTAEYNLGVLLNQIQDPNKKQSITVKQAEIKNLQTQIFNARNDLEKSGTQITAPIDGVITEVPTKEGMPVVQGSALVNIIDPSKLVIKSVIAPYYAADLQVDLEAKIRYTGSETIELGGKVTKVAPEAAAIDNSLMNTNIPIEIEVSNTGNVMKPGFIVGVEVITHMKQEVCMIPLSAVMKDPIESAYVYVIKEDGTLEKRNITLGLNNGTEVEVEQVQEGELLAAHPEGFLKEGMKVAYSLPDDAK